MAEIPTPPFTTLAHLASQLAPIIREVQGDMHSADRALPRAPLVEIPLSAPLPRFPLPLRLEAEMLECTTNAEQTTEITEITEVTEVTEIAQTEHPATSSESEATVPRNPISKRRALEIVEEAEQTQSRTTSSIPPPLAFDASPESAEAPPDSAPFELARASMRRRPAHRGRWLSRYAVPVLLALGAIGALCASLLVVAMLRGVPPTQASAGTKSTRSEPLSKGHCIRCCPRCGAITP